MLKLISFIYFLRQLIVSSPREKKNSQPPPDLAKGFLKPGFHMIVRIVPVVSKKCLNDRDDHMETLPRRSQTTRTTETTSIVWIELNSIQAIEVASVVRVERSSHFSINLG